LKEKIITLRNILLTASFVVLTLNAAVYSQPAHLHASPRPKAALKSPKLKKLICYSLLLRTVADTDYKEQVWDVQLMPLNSPLVNVGPQPPDHLYKTLYSQELLDWVRQLPPGSFISFSIGLGPSVILSDGTRTGDLDPALKSELDAFNQFCNTYKIEFHESITNS